MQPSHCTQNCWPYFLNNRKSYQILCLEKSANILVLSPVLHFRFPLVKFILELTFSFAYKLNYKQQFVTVCECVLWKTLTWITLKYIWNLIDLFLNTIKNTWQTLKHIENIWNYRMPVKNKFWILLEIETYLQTFSNLLQLSIFYIIIYLK